MEKLKNPLAGKVKIIIGLLLLISITALLVFQWKKGFSPSSQKITFEGHQKVSEKTSLRMTFPEKMDTESLKENMDAPIAGEASWEGNTMIFKPDETLNKGETLTFTVNRNAKYASGTPINKDVQYRFTVAGAPVLSSNYPSKDANDIDPKSKIHLVFDRPIIALSSVQGSGAKKYPGAWPVTISPIVNGDWKWLGTTTIEFTPRENLELATTYTVSVPKGIITVNGDKTQDDFSWSFETTRPKVENTDPHDNNINNGPNTKPVLIFNQEMNTEKAVDYIELSEVSGEDLNELSFTLEYGFDEYEEGDQKEENRKKLIVIPNTALKLNSDYRITVKKGIKAAEGDLGSLEDYNINFSTVSNLEINDADGNSGRIYIEFSNPIDNESLQGNINLEPKPDGWDELEFKTNRWSDNMELNIYTGLKASTDYKLTLNTNIKDQFGQKLVESYEYTFKTDALEPYLDILSNGEFGILEKDRAPMYPFEAVNISRIDLEIARVPFEEFIKIRNNKKQNWRFSPNLKNYIGYKKFNIKTQNKLNESEIVNFDIEKELNRKLIPGVYALRIQSPEYLSGTEEKKPIISYQYFSLTNNALTLKYSGNKALVWLVSMKTGQPVNDADIVLYNMEGEKILNGKTNNEGFFESNIDIKDFVTIDNEWNPEFWITATKDGDFTFLGSHWNNGMEPWNFGIQDSFHGPLRADYDLDAYLYTERQAYRPGDTVHFKGITRIRDKNGTINIPKNFDVNVEIWDARGNMIYNKTLDINEFGSFSGELPIDKEASIGSYDISINLLPDDKIEMNYKSNSFYVLEYRKPEYKVEVLPEKDDYFSGDDVTFTITGDYYFGAPMNDAKVSWHAVSSDYWFNRFTDGWYSFSLESNWCWWECKSSTENITKGEGNLDKNGNLKVSFPVDLDDKGVSQMITLNADITDPNNQVVSNSQTVPMHKSNLYVGVKMEDYIVTPGEKARINIVTVNPDGSPKASKKVKVSLYFREWNTIKKKNVDGGYYYENEPKDIFIRKTTITTEKNGQGTAELLVKNGGSYRIVAEATDSNGRVAKSGTSLYAFSSTYINWPHSNNDRIDIIADKPEYKVGDTAKLLVKSPYQGKGVKAMITVERENVISHEVIDIESNAQPIEVKITKNLIPNVYVSAVIIKARDGETFDEEGKDTGMPSFKIGYVKLNVETSQKELKLSVQTDKKKYGPGETVDVTIKSIDFDGNPVSTEVSLGVVDLSVQALLGFRMPNLIRNFYEDRELGVQTSQMLTYLVQAFKPGSKGGGGGDPESRARSNFKDTAYWNPSIITDEDGLATLSFTLPDNLTTWQLLAIGGTKDHEYGVAVHEIIETKKTIVRPLRPRFAVEGDMINVGATVHNFTDETQNFTLTLDGKGFTTNERSEKKLTIKPDEMEKVIFPITVNPGKEISFHFKANGKNTVDEITENIPVYEFGTPQSVATSGYTENDTSEMIYIPSANEAKRGTITTTISPTLATYLPKGLEYLAKFPYGCAEQTVSSFLPNIALKSLQNFDAFEIINDKTLEKNIIAGLEKLYNYQRSDGGFGYWSGSNVSYPYLTAYIVYALNVTQDTGYHVDSSIIGKANTYLKNVLRDQDMTDRISLTTRAYILFVLSENGQTDISLLNNLYDKRKELPLFARAYLAMSYDKNSNKAKTTIQEVIDQVKIDARGAHFEEENEGYWHYSMNTNNRTSALVLQAMVRIMPEHDMIPKIVRHLLVIREMGHWDTTQSTVASIFALTEFLKNTGELNADYTASLKLDDEEILSHKFNTDNILSKSEVKKAFEEMNEEEFNNIVFSKKGTGRLYYDISMDYFLTQDHIKATDQGIGIKREITSLDDDENEFKVQGTYKTKLTITVPEDRHFVAVSSPLPAGFEPIDFTLQTSQQHLQDEVNQKEHGYWWNNPIWRFNHKEFRDDEIFLFADFLPAGVYEYEYLSRATTAGKFRERPARAWEMYYPETFGQTDGDWLEITE